MNPFTIAHVEHGMRIISLEEAIEKEMLTDEEIHEFQAGMYNRQYVLFEDMLLHVLSGKGKSIYPGRRLRLLEDKLLGIDNGT